MKTVKFWATDVQNNFPNLLGPMGRLVACHDNSQRCFWSHAEHAFWSLCLLWKMMLAFKYLKVVSGLVQTKARWSALLSDREEPASAIWQRDFHNFIWLTANGKKITIQVDKIIQISIFCHICQVAFLSVNKENSKLFDIQIVMKKCNPH